MYRLPFVVGLAALTACDSQTDSDHRGGPLAIVRGTISLEASVVPPDMEVVIAWARFTGQPDAAFAQSAEVEGTFPAGFTLPLTEPPPDDALNVFSDRGEVETDFAFGVIVALPRGSTTVDLKQLTPPFGIVSDHVIGWMDSDANDDTFASEFFGATLPEGYHLMRIIPGIEQPDEPPPECEPTTCDGEDNSCDDPPTPPGCVDYAIYGDRLEPAPGGFGTALRLVLTTDRDAFEASLPDLF